MGIRYISGREKEKEKKMESRGRLHMTGRAVTRCRSGDLLQPTSGPSKFSSWIGIAERPVSLPEASRPGRRSGARGGSGTATSVDTARRAGDHPVCLLIPPLA